MRRRRTGLGCWVERTTQVPIPGPVEMGGARNSHPRILLTRFMKGGRGVALTPLIYHGGAGANVATHLLGRDRRPSDERRGRATAARSNGEREGVDERERNTRGGNARTE